MVEHGIVLVAHEELEGSVYPWALLATALGRAGRSPLYVGAPRKPTAAELLRVAAARGDWSPEPEAGPDGVATVRPLDLPARRVEALSRWDRVSLERAVRDHAETGWVVVFSSALGKPWPHPPGWRLCWFPIDEFAAGDPRFAAREERMLAECDLLVSVTETVVAPRRERVPAAAVLPNGYDAALFRPGVAPDPEIAALPGPRVGYVGVVSHTKVDVDLVARLAAARPDVSFVLAGPVPDPAFLAPCAALPNVHVVAPRAREAVPPVYAALDACLLPYRDTPMNRACSPLKAREAVAMGIPLIATPVDELRAHPGCGVVGQDEAALLDAVDALAAGRLAVDADAARWFTDGTWDARAAEFADVLDRVAGGGTR